MNFIAMLFIDISVSQDYDIGDTHPVPVVEDGTGFEGYTEAARIAVRSED